ncbi:MAG: succinylglutamate desuccinylase/aspartoacylase family protein [Thermoguttaceae bacterium]|jgi:predicted deacylase|nr:succinylglutamate desuccinylase/aspartoacylase family protein [Thermoguttaceae bacterium]
MKSNRRSFLKLAGAAGFGLAHTGIGPTNARGQEAGSATNKVTVDHAVATLEDGSTLATPFWRVESGKDGPSLLLLAAQHGNEIHGAEVASRLKDVCARQLVAGSVWLVPMANLPAIRVRRHSVDLGPEQPGRFSQGHNMQQTWPGNPEGNNTERIAYALDQAVVRHCSHGVDMHCWNQFWAAETLATTGHEPSELLGAVTTPRFISYRPVRPPADKVRSITQLMHVRGGGAVVMELSGQYQMNERQVQIGLNSMVNIAKALGMIEGEPEPVEGGQVERSRESSHEVLAPCAGIFMPALQKGTSATLIPDDFVEEGQPLGHIIRESDLAAVPVLAPVAGYLWQLNACHGQLCDASLPAQHPYAEEGNRLALVVTA